MTMPATDRGLITGYTDRDKTRDELLQEIAALRRRVDELSTADPIPTDEHTLRSLRKAIETMQVGVTVTDENGKIVYTNPADARMHGYTVGELLGADVNIFAPPSQTRTLSTTDLQTLRSWERECTNVRRDGSEFPVHLTSDVVVGSDGQAKGIVTCCLDLTERKRTEAALWESEDRYVRAATGAKEGFWDWDLINDRIYYAPRWKAMLGYDEHEIGDRPDEWFSRIPPNDRERVRLAIEAHIRGETSSFEFEYAIECKDGTHRWMRSHAVASRRKNGLAYRITGSQSDITERKEVERRLMYEAFHDPMTELPNRALFGFLVDHAIRESREHGDGFAVLILNLDRFQLVNHSLGPSVADQLLLAVTRRLMTCLRQGDVLARVGGDEFAILIHDVDGPSDPERFAEQLHEALALPFHVDTERVFLTASVGITMPAARYERADEMLRDADAALNRVRRSKRGSHEIFVPALHDLAVERLRLETDLRGAVERNEFEVHYQPIVELVGRRIAGFEALVRWKHPERGLIPPDEFIPLAEETGLIVPIGWWVLRQACDQMQAWQHEFPREKPLSLSVNLSALQFMEPDIVHRVRDTIETTGISPDTLHLEMTETMIVESVDPSYPVFSQLHDLDVRLHMDDFGTGYSSLGHLRRYPVDALKIDRSFITGMGVRREDPEIVRCIIGLARELDMTVIAEGIATEEQAKLLRDLWCQYGQGFHFSKPLPAHEAGQLIRAPLIPRPRHSASKPRPHARLRRYHRRERTSRRFG